MHHYLLAFSDRTKYRQFIHYYFSNEFPHEWDAVLRVAKYSPFLQVVYIEVVW